MIPIPHFLRALFVRVVRSWLVSGFLLLHFTARAAIPETDFHVESWQREDGLPDSTISAITQTRDGFLWLGTPKGVVRFDGAHFRVVPFTNAPTQPANGVSALFTDRSGMMWAGTETGEIYRMTLNGHWIRAGAVGSRVLDFEEAAGGLIWMAYFNGVVGCFSPTNKSYALRTNVAPQFQISSLTADAGGVVWGLHKGKPCHTRGEHWENVGSDELELLHRPSMFAAGRDGSLFSVSGQWWETGLRIHQITNGVTKSIWGAGPQIIGSPRFRATALIEDNAGCLWLGTFGGGVYFARTNGVWQLLAGESPLAHGSILCLFTDREGSVWIGTQSGGLHRARRKLVGTIALPEALRSHLLQSVCASHDGGPWVGTDGAGVFRVNNGAFTPIAAGTDFTNLYVGAVWEDRQTNLWIGSAGGFWQWRNGAIEEADVPGRPFRNVQAIFEDSTGRLWVGGRAKLICRTDSRWANTGLNIGGGPLEIRAIAEDGDGAIWVALFNRGICRVSGGAQELIGASREPALATTRCLFGNQHGLWIGTSGKGLLRYTDGQFTQWTTSDGLASDDINGLVEDADGVLWMASNNGIFGCATEELETFAQGGRPRLLCRQLSVADGLADAACSGIGQPVIARGADAKLWFCNMRAVAAFPPGKPAEMLPPSAATTEEVRVDGVLRNEPELRLPASTRRFEFHYTSVQLVDSRSLFFRYRLEGMDTDWVDAGNERVAHYSQLPAGRYQFRVMAGSSRHGWQTASSAVSIEIVPLWWQRKSVKILAAAALIALIAGGAVLNERRKLRRKLELFEAQQALENERRRIARDLHDDLGAQLTEIVLIGELAKRGEQTPGELKHQVSGMTQKVRQLVSAMEEVVWTVNPKNDSVPNVATYLCDFLERFLSATQISHRLDVSEDLPNLAMAAHTRHNLFLAVKEAVNNAVKHSGAGEIWLRVQVVDRRLRVTLEDNGLGFDAAQPPRTGSGNGLQNMRSRLEAVGGRTQIITSPGSGTTVFFELPLQASGKAC